MEPGPAAPPSEVSLDDEPIYRPDGIERRLIDGYQRDFPLEPRPFAALAAAVGCDEAEVIAALNRLREGGAISRVGPVFRPHAAGASTLAAMAVPPERLDEVAALISARPEVNHNYEREHRLNLWFVVTAADERGVQAVLREVGESTGLPVLDLPLVEDYRIDLGFPLEWS